MKRALHILAVIAVLCTALATALPLPASAEKRSVAVRMSDGTIQYFVVDAPPSATLQDLRTLVPGEPIASEPVLVPTAPSTTPTAPSTAPTGPTPAPQATTETDSDWSKVENGTKPSNSALREAERKAQVEAETQTQPQVKAEVKTRRPSTTNRSGGNRASGGAPSRTTAGVPTPNAPGFMDALPGPSTATGVPNFVINKFRVPVFLLPIYQAAGIQYGVRWEILAAINEIETDYGRNLNISSAGALGWMQFMPATWKQYGVDANKDKKKDPFNPVDAIFAAARYLKAAGYEKDARRAVFAYNHANWYVDSVMLRAKLIAGVPADLVGSLTGLTEGRFPVASRARYADDAKASRTKKVQTGGNAANVVESSDTRRRVDIFAKQGAPVVATNDGQVKKIGRSKKLGRYVVLQDVYGNRYTYAGLGSVARTYAVPKGEATAARSSVKALTANRERRDPTPKVAASAGRPPQKLQRAALRKRRMAARAQDAPRPTATKQRLFANPSLPQARAAGGDDQLLEMQARSGVTSYDGFARPVRLDRRHFKLRRLRVGAHVISGAPLGTVGTPDPDKASHLRFAIRPAGKGAPTIDPKPILDGWKLLEATSIYRASGRNALREGDGGFSIGQIMLLPKPALEKRVLANPGVDIYPGGRESIRSGQVDRRVLATLEYLAASGMRPTVTSLKRAAGGLTASGNISEHGSGNAVDIAAINGTPVMGHQEPGGITEQAVRRLMQLQGTMYPHQIISLFDLGRNTLSMRDHADHIHVGFKPRFGTNARLSAQARAVLRPGQWPELLKRLDQIENPVVSSRPSKYATPVRRLKRIDGLGRP